MKRRDFITLLGGAAAAWPGVVGAQQRPTKIIGLLHGESLALLAKPLESFGEGLREIGYREGQNGVAVFLQVLPIVSGRATFPETIIDPRDAAEFARATGRLQFG
jgi:hypothetical protein